MPYHWHLGSQIHRCMQPLALNLVMHCIRSGDVLLLHSTPRGACLLLTASVPPVAREEQHQHLHLLTTLVLSVHAAGLCYPPPS